MATVRMKKGDKYADIFDSPETIRQAQLDGYSLVEERKIVAKEPVKEEVKETETETVEKPQTRSKR